jgi:hypothetical protein
MAAVDPLLLRGTLHAFVAFDWGEEILLDKVGQLTAASVHALPRRRRTPSSFSYKPAPLQIVLPALPLRLAELGEVQASAGLTIFDFGAVSLFLRIPFVLEPTALLRLAGSLAEPAELVNGARNHLTPHFEQLRPLIKEPHWPDMNEDFFVFQFEPEFKDLASADHLLAGLVHLEAGPLSPEEVVEALKLRLRYSPDDLLICDWAAAVLVDQECEETLNALEFANLQLLEFRHIDDRLDVSLTEADRMIRPLKRRWMPFWRGYSRPLRALGELKVEANGLFERTENVLKLVGDPYLARVYRLAAQRFHLQEWEENIQRKLDVAEGVYQVVADQASHFRTEFLELIVILLILMEIILTLTH